MAGLPDVDTLANLGGTMTDYAPVEDATTDEAAAYRNLYVSNIAGMTQTACRAWRSLVGNAATPTDPASNVHGAVWGDSAGVKPAIARTGAGVYTITWTATQNDFLNVSHTLALRRAWANVEGSTNYWVQASVTSANVVTLYVWLASTGLANDGAGVTFTVFVI